MNCRAVIIFETVVIYIPKDTFANFTEMVFFIVNLSIFLTIFTAVFSESEKKVKCMRTNNKHVILKPYYI